MTEISFERSFKMVFELYISLARLVAWSAEMERVCSAYRELRTNHAMLGLLQSHPRLFLRTVLISRFD